MATLGPNITIGICPQAVQLTKSDSSVQSESEHNVFMVELYIASTEVLLDITVQPNLVRL